MDPATISMIMGATQNSPVMKKLTTPPEAFKSGAGYQGGNPNPLAMMARPGSLINMMPIRYGQNQSFYSGGAMPNAAAPITIPLLNERLTGIRDLGPANPDGMAINAASLQRFGGDAVQNASPQKISVNESAAAKADELGLVDYADPNAQTAIPTRLPKTAEEIAHEQKIQAMQDEAAMTRQLVASGANLLGGLMRAPSPVTVGGYRQNPNLSMYRRRRGLMGG